MNKRIAPAAIQALKEALTLVYWYKSNLRSFLSQCLSDPAVLSRLNWSEYKRNIVATLVDHLAKHQDVYQRDLIRIMSAVCQVTDFSHLRKLEDGMIKAKAAEVAVEALRAQLAGHEDVEEEAQRAEKRRRDAHARVMRSQDRARFRGNNGSVRRTTPEGRERYSPDPSSSRPESEYCGGITIQSIRHDREPRATLAWRGRDRRRPVRQSGWLDGSVAASR